MKTFIVSTENFITKAIACKALKAADTNDITHALYKKACMNGGKLVIANENELVAWRDAIKSYKASDAVESKIRRVLVSRAVTACNKRELVAYVAAC